ncbi:MAG: TonB-dependent receptor [Bryobacterales bacterium]|nr:TonB-dependent receptor [Bryobacterales bacterium]
MVRVSFHRRELCVLAAICTLLMVAPAPRLLAQILYGSIIGNVTDASGASVPGAAVTVTNLETGVSREVSSNSAGAFNAPTLQAGIYAVKVNAPGFRSAEVTKVVVSINNATRINVRLELGQVTESITVTDAAAALQTDRAEVRAEVTAKQLVNLPVPPGRNYQQLFATLPGFTTPTDAHSIPSNPSRALRFNVNGTTGSTNNTRIDGASSTNIWLPHMTAYVPALESIETVNVVTNSFDAEQGLAGGAAVNVQIKSGTNEIHGSAFEYHNNNKTKAKNFWIPTGERNPKLIFNNFGGTVGGPIKRNKIFYFLSYDANVQRLFATRRGTVPTEEMKRGNFLNSQNRIIYDPNTTIDNGNNNIARTPFTNNQIPLARLNPVSGKIIPLWPTANIAGAVSQNNYFAAAPFSFDRQTLDSKFNFNLTDRLTSFVRYSFLDYSAFNAANFGDKLGGDPIAGGNVGNGSGRTHSLTIAGTYSIRPTFLVDAYFGYTKMNTNSEQPRLDENVGLDFLGLPGTNGKRRTEGGWPQIAISGFSGIGITNAYMPYFRKDPQFQYVTNFNWMKGSHNIRFGFDFYDQQLDHAQAEFIGGSAFAASGGFQFQNGTTSQSGAKTNEYNAFASFFLGQVNARGKNILVPDSYQTQTFMSSMYFKDQWQATRKLSLSLGVRWEYLPMPTRPGRGVERFDPKENVMLMCGVGDIPEDCGTKMSKKLFAPRLGVAYRVTERTVLRAGYGISYDPYNLARPLRVNYPILIPYYEPSPNGLLPISQFEDGIPEFPLPDLSSPRIPMPINVNAVFTGDNFRRGYIQSWNATVQHELGGGLTAELGYVATRSVRQLGYVDLNAGQVMNAGNAGRPLYAAFGRTAVSNLVSPIGTQRYDSMQFRLNRRFTNGFQINGAWTWSQNVGVCGANDSDGSPCVRALEFWDRNFTLTSFDQRHRLSINSVYELPFGKGKHWAEQGVAAALLGGWQLNGVMVYFTGSPFTVSGDNRLALPSTGNTADLIDDKIHKTGGVGPGQHFYDPSNFQTVTDVRFGNMDWNALAGPGAFNMDLGIFRSFEVTERIGIQFRAEAFNATNTPKFNNPQGNVNNSRFMEISGERNVGREGINERVFRFGLRLSF